MCIKVLQIFFPFNDQGFAVNADYTFMCLIHVTCHVKSRLNNPLNVLNKYNPLHERGIRIFIMIRRQIIMFLLSTIVTNMPRRNILESDRHTPYSTETSYR